MTIPKTIHYCWFGDQANIYPLARRCVESWKRHMPDWKFVFWQEVPEELPYAKELAKQGRYAFASDYLRTWAVTKHGGIYLDMDVEVVRPLDPLLQNRQFLGYEKKGRVNSSVCGGEADAEFFKTWLSELDRHYQHSKLPLLSPETCTQLVNSGKFPDLKIYPIPVFYPYNPYDETRPVDQLMYADITPETLAIHHWAKGWKFSLTERLLRLGQKIANKLLK